MGYSNLAVALKHMRNSTINTVLGSTPYLMIYSGSYPLSPDIPVASGTLLCSLPCSYPFGTVTYFVQNATVSVAGTGGVNGTQVVSGTTGSGTMFQATVTIQNGGIVAVNSINFPGTYINMPSSLVSEPVSGASLTGAFLSLAMSSTLTASAITQSNAAATGTAGFARLTAYNVPGGAGIIDLDVATSNASVIISTTAIVITSPVAVTSCVISEP